MHNIWINWSTPFSLLFWLTNRQKTESKLSQNNISSYATTFREHGLKNWDKCIIYDSINKNNAYVFYLFCFVRLASLAVCHTLNISWIVYFLGVRNLCTASRKTNIFEKWKALALTLFLEKRRLLWRLFFFFTRKNNCIIYKIL